METDGQTRSDRKKSRPTCRRRWAPSRYRYLLIPRVSLRSKVFAQTPSYKGSAIKKSFFALRFYEGLSRFRFRLDQTPVRPRASARTFMARIVRRRGRRWRRSEIATRRRILPHFVATRFPHSDRYEHFGSGLTTLTNE